MKNIVLSAEESELEILKSEVETLKSYIKILKDTISMQNTSLGPDIHYMINHIKTDKLISSIKGVVDNLKIHFKSAKVWIYKDKIGVLDFKIQNHRIAFDIEFDSSSGLITTWLFCRDDRELIKILIQNPLDIKSNKVCIFKDNVAKFDELICAIKEKYNFIVNYNIYIY